MRVMLTIFSFYIGDHIFRLTFFLRVIKMACSNVTSGFIDLATFDEVEKYQYGSNQAFAYFVRETRKSTWFTQVPVMLARLSGSPGFGKEWSVQISRAADYLMHVWLRVRTPEVTLLTTNQFGVNGRIHWTKNFMHNLVRDCCITFNDLVAERFDSYYLDFWAAFTTPASKQEGYNNMIGNIDQLIAPHAPGVPLLERHLNLPLPFFFCRDTGVALPTAALPYNEMRINFCFRPWHELLILENSVPVTGVNPFVRPIVGPTADIAHEPHLEHANVWANYAIMSNEERKRMACAPRDILVEQVQCAPKHNFHPMTNKCPRYDIRFSHSIKVLFFASQNVTSENVRSNYTTASPVPGPVIDNYTPSNCWDPIEHATLTYENTDRLSQMGSDYFALVNPWYMAPTIPSETGYHMYSYSLNFFDVDPLGSTNYGKLTNVSLAPHCSEAAMIAQQGSGPPGSGADYPQKFEFIIVAVNSNIVRISGGALGFPVL